MIPTPDSITTPKPHLIAMVHVHSNNALQNTVYNDRLGVSTYRQRDLEVLKKARTAFKKLHEEVITEHQIDFLRESKSSIFLLKQAEVASLLEQLMTLPFIKEIVDHALTEVDIYTRNRFNMVAIENVGAPYFIGQDVPFEELAIMHLVAQAVRKAFPKVVMGMHVLTGDELESLPIAMAADCYFVRSEASIFSGFRPEGRMHNHGNLAKFFYLRNYFNTFLGVEDPKDRRYPQIWSDLQKKHTVFEQELRDLSIWLGNIMFVKLEGIILTGAETGKNIDTHDFELARAAIEEHKKATEAYFGEAIEIPLITGSGLDVEIYKKYADFIITGTQLKENKYWENRVSEEKVKELIAKFRG